MTVPQDSDPKSKGGGGAESGDLMRTTSFGSGSITIKGKY